MANNTAVNVGSSAEFSPYISANCGTTKSNKINVSESEIPNTMAG